MAYRSVLMGFCSPRMGKRSMFLPSSVTELRHHVVALVSTLVLGTRLSQLLAVFFCFC